MDLAAQDETLGADSRVVTGGKPGDLVAALAAEAASPLSRVVDHAGQRAECGVGGLAGADDCRGHVDAVLANVDVRPGHELARLALRPTAEGAGQLGRQPAAATPATAAAGRLDDLVDPLVAEIQGGGELTQ